VYWKWEDKKRMHPRAAAEEDAGGEQQLRQTQQLKQMQSGSSS